MESNHRPPPYQGGALPTELREQKCIHHAAILDAVERAGILPAFQNNANRHPCRHIAKTTAARRLHVSGSAHPAPTAKFNRAWINGAGDGNRTRTSSLEGYSSTIELLPPGVFQGSSGGGRWIRTTEGMSQQIYSLPPLAAWVSLRTLETSLRDSRRGKSCGRQKPADPRSVGEPFETTLHGAAYFRAPYPLLSRTVLPVRRNVRCRKPGGPHRGSGRFPARCSCPAP